MEKYTFTDAYYDIQNEGEGYYLLHYTDGSELPDEKSKELFNKAVDGVQEFLKYIETKKKEEEKQNV